MNRNSKIVSALTARGATKEQAQQYMALVEMFERQSAGSGEVHHILPRGCGWWKRFGNSNWNQAIVEWRLHISLHAYLCHIFPDNAALYDGLRAATMYRRGAFKKNRKDKSKIIHWYGQGRSATWIAKKVNVSPAAIYIWLRSWGVKVRSNVEAKTSPKKTKYKQQIIDWYREGRPATWINRRIGFRGGANTVIGWLKSWGIKARSTAEARECSYRFKYRTKFKRILSEYVSGNSLEGVGRKLNLDPKIIKKFLKLEGIAIRPNTYGTSPKKTNFKNRVVEWYAQGDSMSVIEKKVGISRGAIRDWLIEWGIKPRPRGTAWHTRHIKRGITNPDCKFCTTARAT
jgi:transposase